MKTNLTRLAILLLLSLTTFHAHAQWVDPGNDNTGDIYYNNGNVGIGTSSPVYPLVVTHSPYSIGTSGTNYKIGTEIKIFDSYNIPNGITESGYRMGLNIATQVNDPNFLGTLNGQYGMRIQYGSYTNSGTGTINSSYGLYLHGLETGNASITNKYGIYQTGANFKNYFQGNVGIGTNSPSEMLSFYKYNDAVKIRLQNSATSWRLINDVNAKFILNGQLSGDVFVIDDTNGNVGIGTTSPGYTLVVKGGQTATKGINIMDSNSRIYFDGRRALEGHSSASRLDVGEGYSNIQLFGNIGIGTTTPSEKLEVNGTIRTKEVKVESTPWPDYVFSDTYKLNPLSEVSSYIQENHHLPGIPTAEEVAENGIKLGEMNAKLLEKVEELTLYLIEKDKEISDLKERMSKLEN